MNWILCKERMPDSPRPVLVYNAYGDMRILMWNDKGWHDSANYGYVSDLITHWAELEPPEGVQTRGSPRA